MNNCGKPFRLEIASREFENDFRKLLGNRSHQRYVSEILIQCFNYYQKLDRLLCREKSLLTQYLICRVQERLKGMLRGWAEGDFKSDPQLALIPSLYNQLQKEGIDFSSASSSSHVSIQVISNFDKVIDFVSF